LTIRSRDAEINPAIQPSEKEQISQLLLSCEYGMARMYFQGNMFEKSLEACNNALKLKRNFFGILNFRATTLTILGRYKDAVEDYISILENDTTRAIVPDAISGLAKILIAKESIVPGGWSLIVSTVEELLPDATATYNELVGQKETQKDNPHYFTLIQQACGPLRRLHYALFNYYDRKTEDVDKAFENLSLAAHYATTSSPGDTDSNLQFQEMQTANIKQIFSKDFFTGNAAFGHQSRKPVFIIGFYRSGSTLTERVLDAHPDIVGTGEDSVFNNYLEHIRNQIVSISTKGGDLGAAIQTLGDEVVELIEDRWDMVSKTKSDTLSEEKSLKPKRYVDKMLSNYRNLGFIHLLFPKALIIHVIREPMDVVFSSFKHDFSAGALDHTNEFQSLAHAYRTYRELIDHWDEVLPGRIKHVRYEDMVHDMPGVAKAIIRSTGLPWDESVLDFHKKKHAVNTLSSTQVRKGVYKSAIKSWKKYETHLQPLVKLVGNRVKSNIKTTLPGYKKPPNENNA